MKAYLLSSALRRFPWLCFVFFVTVSVSWAQETIIDYTTAGLSTTMLDVFSNQPVIGGYTHTTISSIPTGNELISTPNGATYKRILPPEYKKHALYISAVLTDVTVCDVNNSCYSQHIAATDAYQLNYTFLPNFSYSISMTISGEIPRLFLYQFVGLGISVGAPQFTRNVNDAKIIQARMNGGIGQGPPLGDYILDDDFLANTLYTSYYPIYTDTVSHDLNITIPAFTVNTASTGLNIETLPAVGDGGPQTSLIIKNIHIKATPLISPSTALICSSQTFTTDAQVPVTWTTSSPNIISLTPSGNNVIVNKVGLGQAILTASIGNGISSSITVYTQGQSSISSSSIGGCQGSYQTWYLNATPVPNAPATNWNWSVSNNAHGSFYIYNRSSPQTYIDVSGGGGINLTYTDACGQTSPLNGVTVYSGCRGSGAFSAFSVFPNPASNTVTVSVPTEASEPPPSARAAAEGSALPEVIQASRQTTVTRGVDNIAQIILLDQTNTVKKTMTYDEPVQSSQLSLTGVTPGLYYLKIYDGHNWTTQKLLVE